MPDFESRWDYLFFRDRVRYRFRHVFDAKTQAFLEAIREGVTARSRTLPEFSQFWRACLGCDDSNYRDDAASLSFFDQKRPFAPSRMVPLPDRAREGRINPKGIPCLYLSDQRDTAIAEVRPWVGSIVSVAKFCTIRNLRIVDCTCSEFPVTMGFGELSEYTAAQREAVVWQLINLAFAEPVTRDDELNVADYAPTQVLAERFKAEGLDGIFYSSRLGTGKNLALFKIDTARLMARELYEVAEVTVKSSRVGARYVEDIYRGFIDLDEHGEMI